MRKFQYVFYGIIDVKLSSMLHIGGDEEGEMLLDGEGQYILPATSIMGCVKHAADAVSLSERELLGDKTKESVVYFYDAVLKDVEVEERSGNRIDPKFGTAADRGLYKRLYIGQGAKTEIRMQAFLNSEEELAQAENLFIFITEAIQSHTLVFGAHTSAGAGEFDVTSLRKNVLDLSKEEDSAAYIAGTEECFKFCKEIEFPENEAKLPGYIFRLTAEIPQGILVRGDEKKEEDKSSLYAVNVTKKIDGRDVYYIPGTSLKGILRSYGVRMANTLGIPEDVTNQIFGSDTESTSDKKYKSSLHVRDAVIVEPQKMMLSRTVIDRWLGGVIEGKKAAVEVIMTGSQPVELTVSIDSRLNEKLQPIARAMVYMCLRDIGLGRVTIGSGASVGYGICKGITLQSGEETYSFQENEIVVPEKSIIYKDLEVMRGNCNENRED